MSTTKPETLLWLSDARGQYIPRDFAKSFADRAAAVAGVTAEQWAILEHGPEGALDSKDGENEFYWEVWMEVCESAVVTDGGVKYRIHQDGDCWLVPEGVEWDESQETFVWPNENGDSE